MYNLCIKLIHTINEYDFIYIWATNTQIILPKFNNITYEIIVDEDNMMKTNIRSQRAYIS